MDTRDITSWLVRNALIWYLMVTFVMQSVTGYALLDIRQDEKAKLLHRLDSLNILAYTLLLILTVCTIWLFKWRRIQFLHETGLAIFYGLIVGAIIRYVGQESEVSHLRYPYMSFSSVPLLSVIKQNIYFILFFY